MFDGSDSYLSVPSTQNFNTGRAPYVNLQIISCCPSEQEEDLDNTLSPIISRQEELS
jgi:hypothetical protein